MICIFSIHTIFNICSLVIIKYNDRFSSWKRRNNIPFLNISSLDRTASQLVEPIFLQCFTRYSLCLHKKQINFSVEIYNAMNNYKPYFYIFHNTETKIDETIYFYILIQNKNEQTKNKSFILQKSGKK